MLPNRRYFLAIQNESLRSGYYRTVGRIMKVLSDLSESCQRKQELLQSNLVDELAERMETELCGRHVGVTSTGVHLHPLQALTRAGQDPSNPSTRSLTSSSSSSSSNSSSSSSSPPTPRLLSSSTVRRGGLRRTPPPSPSAFEECGRKRSGQQKASRGSFQSYKFPPFIPTISNMQHPSKPLGLDDSLQLTLSVFFRYVNKTPRGNSAVTSEKSYRILRSILISKTKREKRSSMGRISIWKIAMAISVRLDIPRTSEVEEYKCWNIRTTIGGHVADGGSIIGEFRYSYEYSSNLAGTPTPIDLHSVLLPLLRLGAIS
uniref:Uncharacterized protein n=1 Tax=Vespula pensylvanica TaxID=30213 RepID=A0A834P639_VESPE|nr:hypothetical protein H0235_006091 [Vespula pensylvanica]